MNRPSPDDMKEIMKAEKTKLTRKEVCGLCVLFFSIGYIVGLTYGGAVMKKQMDHRIEHPQPTKQSCVDLFLNN